MESHDRVEWMEFLQSARLGLGLHFHFSLSCTVEGNGNPLQCSCLENPRGSRTWWAAVYGVAQSRTRLKRLSSSSSRLGLVSECASYLCVTLDATVREASLSLKAMKDK